MKLVLNFESRQAMAAEPSKMAATVLAANILRSNLFGATIASEHSVAVTANAM